MANLKEGIKVEDVFLVISKSVATTRAGLPYLKLKLADRTGEVDAVKWDASESEISKMREDDYVLVHAMVRTYNDSPQLTIDSFTKYGEDVDPADFIRSSPHDPEKMMAEFLSYIDQVSDPHLRQLMDGIFADEDIARKFRQAPAATRIHHAYVSGLLEHSLNVVKICIAIADLYPKVDKELLIAGAALHDIGKMEEFVWSGAIKYSDVGHFVGHIVSGAMLVKEVADGIDGFDPMMSLALQHMILSHHGTHEFGSPKLPKSIEAVILHKADDLDAQISIFERAIAESDENGEDGLFTKRHFLLQRPIFKGLSRKTLDSESDNDDADLDLFAVEPEFDPFAD